MSTKSIDTKYVRGERELPTVCELTEENHVTPLDVDFSPTSDAKKADEGEPTADAGSVLSVQTEHYLDQIYDREQRQSARQNIDWLRANGFAVRGELVDGNYSVRFSSSVNVYEVMSLKQFVKAKVQRLYNKGLNARH